MKTDLFDEAMTSGVVPVIRELADSVTGIDLHPHVAQQAQRRYPEMATVVGDVRQLPFDDGCFDLVVSLSTLDHLAEVAEIECAIRELARVLVPEGMLVLTVDNQANPVVALRDLLPGAALRRMGLVAYPVGPSVGPHRLERLVCAAGMRPRGRAALMHCPRLPAVMLARLLERSPIARNGFLRTARRFDALDRLPTRYLTAYFAGIVAERWLDAERAAVEG